MVKLVKYIYTTYGYLYALNLIMGYRNPTKSFNRDFLHFLDFHEMKLSKLDIKSVSKKR